MQSFKPSILRHWFLFIVSAFFLLLAFASFGIKTKTGLIMASVSGGVAVYRVLSVYTTCLRVTQQGISVKIGPFSRRFRDISYRDVNNVAITQGAMQKRFKIGNLTIHTARATLICKGFKNPHQIKELMNEEKASEFERRTLLRKLL